MALSTTAERARDKARRRHRRQKYLIALLGLLLTISAYQYGWERGTDHVQEVRRAESFRMNPPPRFTPVIAWTDKDTWRKAYRDDNDEFRNTEDGLPIGQVYRWQYP